MGSWSFTASSPCSSAAPSSPSWVSLCNRYRHPRSSPATWIGKQDPATCSPALPVLETRRSFAGGRFALALRYFLRTRFEKKPPMSQTSWAEMSSNPKSPQEFPHRLQLGTETKPPQCPQAYHGTKPREPHSEGLQSQGTQEEGGNN